MYFDSADSNRVDFESTDRASLWCDERGTALKGLANGCAGAGDENETKLGVCALEAVSEALDNGLLVNRRCLKGDAFRYRLLQLSLIVRIRTEMLTLP